MKLKKAIKASEVRIRDRLHPDMRMATIKNILHSRGHMRVLLWRCFVINKLPVEILLLILQHALNAETISELNKTRSRLIHVCAPWRRILLDTPSAWNTIEFSKRMSLEGCLFALRHSGKMPLQIMVDHTDPLWTKGEDDPHYFRARDMIKIMKVVLHFMDRVQALFIRVDTWEVTLAGLCSLAKAPPAPLLTSFEFYRSGPCYASFSGGAPEALRTPQSIFKNGAPSITHVRLCGVHIDWKAHPFRNLDTLDLRQTATELMPPTKTFQAMLANSPNLRRLYLDSTGPKFSKNAPDDVGPPVQLLKLQELMMVDLSTDFAHYVLQQFSAPNLKQLAFVGFTEDFLDILQYTTGLFPRLTVLALDSIFICTDEASRSLAVPWLRSMPRLRYLRLSRVPPRFIDVITNVFHVTPESQELEHLCPKLRVFEFGWVNYAMIAAILDKRQVDKSYIAEDTVRSFTDEEYKQLLPYLIAGTMGIILNSKPVRPELLYIDSDVED